MPSNKMNYIDNPLVLSEKYVIVDEDDEGEDEEFELKEEEKPKGHVKRVS